MGRNRLRPELARWFGARVVWSLLCFGGAIICFCMLILAAEAAFILPLCFCEISGLLFGHLCGFDLNFTPSCFWGPEVFLDILEGWWEAFFEVVRFWIVALVMPLGPSFLGRSV
ncbi:hypothetical protein Nepgr_007948 [Nepenthes gracilis]|uniref:Uncharacterized protein n=1 Tax=Nepenthes gracilis TaxID=150966 RepID=A0AAD3S7T7_NEPGR|nr:hypothetical protein Nepgr_007948 [Nepenthes gracilis]